MTRGPRPDANMTKGELGYGAILDADLTVERVPPQGTPFWMEVAEFALSFDGYQYRGPALGRWANSQADRFGENGRLDDNLSLRDLRALLFYEQRRFRHLIARHLASDELARSDPVELTGTSGFRYVLQGVQVDRASTGRRRGDASSHALELRP